MNIILLPESAQHLSEFKVTDPKQMTHINSVLRLAVGECIKIGCLSGNIGQATITQINASSITLGNIHCEQQPPLKLDLTVMLALPRPKVLRRLIMDMTAIGVANIVLVNSYCTHKSYWQSPMLNRLDEFIKDGLQQGIDTLAPTIQLRKRLKPFVEDELSLRLQNAHGVVAHPYVSQAFDQYQQAYGLPQILCIGPEGGWIDYEVDLLIKHGCHAVSLGPRILRTEAVVNLLCGRYV